MCPPGTLTPARRLRPHHSLGKARTEHLEERARAARFTPKAVLFVMGQLARAGNVFCVRRARWTVPRRTRRLPREACGDLRTVSSRHSSAPARRTSARPDCSGTAATSSRSRRPQPSWRRRAERPSHLPEARLTARARWQGVLQLVPNLVVVGSGRAQRRSSSAFDATQPQVLSLRQLVPAGPGMHQHFDRRRAPGCTCGPLAMLQLAHAT